MEMRKEKRTAKVRLTLTKRTVEGLVPTVKPWIAWDNKLTGFGVRIQPSGTKSFLVNYRANGGGRHAANKRVVIGRFGRITPGSGPQASPGTARARRRGGRPGGRARKGAGPADAAGSLRGLFGGQSEPCARYGVHLSPEPEGEPVRLGESTAGCHFAEGRGGAFQLPHREARLVRGQSDHFHAAFDLPAPVRGPRQVEKPGGAMAGRGWKIPPQTKTADLRAQRSVATLAGGYRGGKDASGCP